LGAIAKIFGQQPAAETEKNKYFFVFIISYLFIPSTEMECPKSDAICSG